MKKSIIVAVAALALAQVASAQTNLQTFYDFGRNRGHFTTTLEGFYGDNWGNTFFFIDYDYNAKDNNGVNQAPSGSYMEIARCLNFWGDTQLAPLSLQVEYNGLVGVNQNFLFGVDYFLHSDDFANTFNFKLLYKTFSNGATSSLPLQFTFVCCSFVCGCSGSTSGGIKIDRAILAGKGIHNKVILALSPNLIRPIRVDGRIRPDNHVSDAFSFIFCYMLVVIMFAAVNLAGGMDFTSGITASIACIGNVGPGFGEVGSMGNYAGLSDFLKVTSLIEMLVGRLEIFPILYLLRSLHAR